MLNWKCKLISSLLLNKQKFKCNYLKLDESVKNLSTALYEALTVKKVHTKDIGGQNRASQLVDQMLENLKKNSR